MEGRSGSGGAICILSPLRPPLLRRTDALFASSVPPSFAASAAAAAWNSRSIPRMTPIHFGLSRNFIEKRERGERGRHEMSRATAAQSSLPKLPNIASSPPLPKHATPRCYRRRDASLIFRFLENRYYCILFQLFTKRYKKMVMLMPLSSIKTQSPSFNLRFQGRNISRRIRQCKSPPNLEFDNPVHNSKSWQPKDGRSD